MIIECSYSIKGDVYPPAVRAELAVVIAQQYGSDDRVIECSVTTRISAYATDVVTGDNVQVYDIGAFGVLEDERMLKVNNLNVLFVVEDGVDPDDFYDEVAAYLQPMYWNSAKSVFTLVTNGVSFSQGMNNRTKPQCP